MGRQESSRLRGGSAEAPQLGCSRAAGRWCSGRRTEVKRRCGNIFSTHATNGIAGGGPLENECASHAGKEAEGNLMLPPLLFFKNTREKKSENEMSVSKNPGGKGRSLRCAFLNIMLGIFLTSLPFLLQKKP